jgi:hypothetical protein
MEINHIILLVLIGLAIYYFATHVCQEHFSSAESEMVPVHQMTSEMVPTQTVFMKPLQQESPIPGTIPVMLAPASEILSAAAAAQPAVSSVCSPQVVSNALSEYSYDEVMANNEYMLF